MSLIDDLKKSGVKPVNNSGGASQPVSQPNNNSNRLINDLVRSGVKPMQNTPTAPAPVQTVTPQSVTPTPAPTPAPQTTTPSFLNNLFETLGIAATQAQRATAGVQAPIETQQAENNRLAELGAARAGAAQERKRLEELRKQTTDWDGRSKLLSELNDIDANSGFITNEQEANAAAARRRDIINQLEAGDEAAGNAPRTYTDNERARSIFEGATGDYIKGHINQAGTILDALYSGINTSENAGYAVDPLSAEQIGFERDETKLRDFSSLKSAADTLEASADKLGVDATDDLRRAKAGLGTIGQAGVDIATNIIQMGYDAALGRMAGVNGLALMFNRSSGSAAQEARQQGANVSQQLVYGAAKGGIEVATEKIFDGVAGIFGKGVADDVVEGVIGKLASSNTGRTMLRVIAGAGGEGLEEAISDFLSPLAESIYKDESLRALYGNIDISEVVYDFLIGAAIGGLGSTSSIATGQNAQKNAELNERMATEERVNQQLQGVMEALTGRQQTAQTGTPAETAPLNPADLLAEQVAGPAQQAAETPVEAAQPVGVIPAPPPTTESTTAQPQALNSATVEQPTQKRRAADVASDLINRTGTTQSREAVTAAVQEIADYIKSNNNGEGADPEVLRQMAERAASEMIDNIPGTPTGDPTVYNALRSFLTGRDIEISDELRGDVTDYNDWRKSLFGKLNMRKDGVSIDTLYAELSTQFPGLFPADITAHSDQINRIVEVMDSTRPQAGRLVDEISDADYNGLLDEATQAILDAAPDVLSTETSMSEENLASLDETAPPNLVDLSRLQGTTPAVTQTANGAEAAPKRSQTESNTLQEVAKRNGGKQEELYYIPISERQTMTEAMNRVNADMVGEMNSLADKDMWTAADIDTGMTIYGMLKADAVRAGDNTAANTWAKVVQSRGTKSGQALQAFSKWTRSAAGQASYAADQIAEASNLSPEEKTRITNDIYNFAAEIDGVEDGDISSLREIIKRQSEYRGTGTFYGKNFGAILDQITDYEYLREYAQRQLMSMASDATDTATLGDKLKTWQVSAQLSRLGTFFRNIGGNVLFGAQDTLTQDGLGVALDWLVAKGTGKRTVGFDKSWFSVEARKGAKEAMLRSILEVAGDVNMDGDASKYGTTANRTNKMSGGKFSQFMSRWEQILGYSLTTSDRTSRGSIETAIRESLQNSGLTDAEIDAIAEGTADYRLFQNQDLAYKVSKGLHDVMNLVGVGGEVRGVTRSGGFGAGDLVNPYPGVPANLAVKALEYSPANIVKGGVELFDLFRDIKNGTYDATKQNRAVMDIARGMAGTPIIALLAAAFKTGIIKNSDDEDDLDVAAQNRAEGKSGVQINLDAWGRANKGENAEWKDGDDLLSIGWLEPMNAFMAIASMIAAEDDRSISTVTGDYFSGTLQGLLEMPVMGNIANVVDSFRYSTADKLGEKVADAGIGLLGDAASGMIPAPISQAARTSDLYYRDTGGDNKTEQVINNLLSSIPGARQTLPTKLDNFGRPKEYSNSAAQRFLNNFVLPGAVNELNQSDESKALEQLREASGETSFYPDRKAPSKVNLPGENGNGESVKLTTEEKRAYQEAYGGTYTDLLSSLLTGNAWDNMTTEAQAETAKAIEAYAKDEAKRAIAEAQGRKYESDYDDERKLPADSLADYFGAKESLKLARDNKDYTTLDALIDTLDEYPQAVREKLYDDINRLEDMEAAAKKGVDSEEFTRAYDQYLAINKKKITPSDKAEEMKTWIRTSDLPKAKQDVLDDLLKYVSTSVVEAKTYDALREALGDPKMAQHFSHLKREEEANNAAEILSFVANDKEYQDTAVREKVLGTLLTEGQYAKYERAKAEKISMESWAKFLTELRKATVARTKGKSTTPSNADIRTACKKCKWMTEADYKQLLRVYRGN